MERLIENLMHDVTALGAMPFHLLLAALLFLLGASQLSLWLFLGLVLSYAIVWPIRVLYFKNRPKKLSYKGRLEKIDASSFPSLHAFRVTMVAIFMWTYAWRMGLLFACLGVAVIFTRYYLRKHDWRDLLGGMLFGAATAALILLLFP